MLKKDKIMKYEELVARVSQWGTDKGITGKGGKANPLTQQIKLFEETNELYAAIVNGDTAEQRDAIGDCQVVLILMCDLLNLDYQDCLNEAYNVIAKRTGKMVNGVFVKDK